MRLNTILGKILHADYERFEDLLEVSDIYSNESLRDNLDKIMREWKNNKISLSVLNAQLKFIYSYIDQQRIKISFQNHIAFPIGYFSSFLRLNACFIYSYLKTNYINVKLFRLYKGFDKFKNFIKSKKPPYVIFTLSQFHYLDYLKQLIPFLENQNVNVVLGGNVFIYDEDLKKSFPNSIFPKDCSELVNLLKLTIKV
ncbi:MAG: hypothetical protein GF383_00160 [Candidatus Lokiarchaeota archaeon]|nr:hypothetical protein [Candidatus Lokiarchaeota archaeon]MBD3337507.1 hypothetical protein [Candidatus Lokiarchaeota archaeon]